MGNNHLNLSSSILYGLILLKSSSFKFLYDAKRGIDNMLGSYFYVLCSTLYNTLIYFFKS